MYTVGGYSRSRCSGNCASVVSSHCGLVSKLKNPPPGSTWLVCRCCGGVDAERFGHYDSSWLAFGEMV